MLSSCVGLFFGSFNPIHNGHLNIARYLLDNGYCREVWFIVSPQNPLKQEQSLLAESERMEMVRLAIAKDGRMKACDVEFSMPKPSYTIDTLRLLSARYSDRVFALIIGGDNLLNFHLWKSYQGIVAKYPILVYPRPKVDVSGVRYEHVTLVDAPLSDVSSTEIRGKIKRGEDVVQYVPTEVLQLVLRAWGEEGGEIKEEG